MDDGAVLNIRSRPNPDGIHIAAQHAIIPDARLRADVHIANDAAPRRDEGGRMNLRRMAVQGDDGDIIHGPVMAD